MAGELLLRLAVEFNGDGHIMAHFTGNDEAQQQDCIRLVQDNGCGRVAAMDQFQQDGSG